jgi:tRNA threonylcarbamoyladenosine modification (KEOPS) complex  Pcc1 subunit
VPAVKQEANEVKMEIEQKVLVDLRGVVEKWLRAVNLSA